MWILQLNPMRANTEACLPVARAETREALEVFLQREAVEPYLDGQWRKAFRRGGPFEWFNPPMGSDLFYDEFLNVGALEDWINSTRQRWNRMLIEIPEVR